MNLLSFLKPQNVATYYSKFNGEIKVIESFGKKAVYVDSAPQSGAEIRPMWKQIIERIQNSEFRIQNCLVLGIGGGDVIRMINRHFPQAKITALEIDPVMVKVAGKYFGLEESKKCKIIIDDALVFVKKENEEKFDLIVVDLFVGKYNPESSRQINFAENLKKLLRKNGLILFNAHFKDTDESGELKSIYSKLFLSVSEIFNYRYNHVLLIKPKKW